jgi:hypothetical protein
MSTDGSAPGECVCVLTFSSAVSWAGLAGYLAGAYLACNWLLPGSNLCGLPAVLLVAPLGAVVGGWAAGRGGPPSRGVH